MKHCTECRKYLPTEFFRTGHGVCDACRGLITPPQKRRPKRCELCDCVPLPNFDRGDNGKLIEYRGQFICSACLNPEYLSEPLRMTEQCALADRGMM